MTFDLLTSASVHAEVLPCHLPTLVLIAQAVFLLERGQTDIQIKRQMRLNALPTPAAIHPAWVTKTEIGLLSFA